MAVEGAAEYHVLRQIQMHAVFVLEPVWAVNSQCHEVDAAGSTADLWDKKNKTRIPAFNLYDNRYKLRY